MIDSPRGMPGYAVLLTRGDIDRFEHNVLFAREFIAAFGAAGVLLRPIDYIKEPRKVFAAMNDSACGFFLSFNGFGSELKIPATLRGQLVSAYSAFRKPLFDIMHDCPAHETMAHQLGSTFPERTLLITDYGYAGVATSMGFPNVLYVPSITFPTTVTAVKPMADRNVSVLFPVSLPLPRLVEDRHSADGGYKERLYHSLFHDVSAKAVADWRIDPLEELAKACREVGIWLDWSDADDRFLLTTVMDQTKFTRRQRLLAAIAHLPVTIMTDRALANLPKNSRAEVVEARSASEMVRLMGDCRCVVCPTPHITGFHERALAAFSAGSAVISSPNRVFEAEFVHGRDLMFFRNEEDAARIIEALLNDTGRLESIAETGRARAGRLFPPSRPVETILSLLDLQRPAGG